MTNEELNKELEQLKEQDISYNKVSSSRLVFYLALFSMLAFVVGCTSHLYHERYKGKPDVEINPASLYTPKYQD